MNLSRSLSRLLSSSSPKKWTLLRPIALLQSFSLSTESTPAKRAYKRNPKPLASKPEWKQLGFSQTDVTNFPRPSEIPFQPNVANSVHLVGTIGVPVQLQTLPDGIYAVSVLVQEKKKDSPQLWIPVIFQGDLAQIAACHLKESDLVYITGQLSGDAPPLTVEDAQTNIQVLAHSLSFVQKTFPEKEDHVAYEQDEATSDCSAEIEENPSNLHLWNDLFANPHNWWDNRSSESNPARAAFKHKDSGQLLWINDSTPEWVLSKLDMLSFGQKSSKKSENSGGVKKLNDITESLWNDLVDNPRQWWDNRVDKLNGSVNPKYPDFKQKNTQKALWLHSAPDWVLPKLNGLVFDGSNNMSRQQKDDNLGSTQKTGKENLWKNLVENPKKWWDNRSNKLKPTHPDFKHKDTGEALWLGPSTPPWVLPKLPPLDAKQDVGRKKATVRHYTFLSTK